MAKEKQNTTSVTNLSVPTVFKIADSEINKETLLSQRIEDTKLIINGVSDTAGYKKAIELRGLYRTTRTTLERVRKQMSEPHQEFVKQLKKTTDELGSIAQQGEIYFDEMITAIDNEKERIKTERVLAEQKRIAGRISELTALGAIFDGENYCFPYSEVLIVTPEDVRELGIQAFSDLICDIEVEYDKEQDRLTKEKENQALLAQQQADEAEKVSQQQLANQEAEKVLAEKTKALRMKELRLMGAVLQDDGTYKVTDKPTLHLAPLSVLLEYSDEEWDQLIVEIDSFA